MRLPLILAALFCLTSVRAEIGNGTGLQISAAGDILGSFGKGSKDKLIPREGEVLVFAPIDQLFDGVINLAAHDEAGKVFFEVHEMTIGSTKLIPRSRFRIGQLFLGIGRLNQFHRHDWPFTSAPKVQSDFLHEEGVNDTGIEYGYLFPTPFYLDLTVGVANGWIFGHAHSEGFKPKGPTHYARLATFNTLFWDGGMQTGLNYLGRTDSAGTKVTLLGVDHTAKWKENTILTFLLQSEVWYRIKTPSGGASEKTLGFYVYPQYGISPSWSVGMRIDGYSVLSLEDASKSHIGNYDYGFVPTVTYKASEFSTIRASMNFKGHLSQGVESSPERVFEIQSVFILGSHPAHDF